MVASSSQAKPRTKGVFITTEVATVADLRARVVRADTLWPASGPGRLSDLKKSAATRSGRSLFRAILRLWYRHRLVARSYPSAQRILVSIF